ncbi:MAG TPA: enoyl-CoA hydratase-related protein [Gemmatimonadaceae bacterium]
MTYENLRLSVADRIGTITIHRPDKLNALNMATIDELDRAIIALVANPEVAAVILTGAGRAFAAGADIAELAAYDAAGARELSRRGQEVFARFESSHKPVVAAVNGFALGGGCELAMACHVRLASDLAKFGQPEVKLGLIPGYGGTQRLPRLVGPGHAAQLLLTGEIIDATEAARIGLVNRVVPAAELMTATEALVRQMIANAPLALGRILDALRRAVDAPPSALYDLETTGFMTLAGSEDAREGTAAFLEKRAPRFQGR